MKFKSGCKVPFPDQIVEGYKIENGYITANIDIGHIEEVMRHFIVMHEEPLFFILELPASENDEKEIEPGILDKQHKDVYYIDNCSQMEAMVIMSRAGRLLFNDGLSAFGYGGQESSDEIMFGKYNVLTIISKNINQYNEFFKFHNIEKNQNLVTAWETFDERHPGQSNIITIRGKNIYSLPAQFKEFGMYFAEQREE